MSIQARDPSAAIPAGGYADIKAKVQADGQTAILYVIQTDASGNPVSVSTSSSPSSIRTSAGPPAPGQVAKNYTGTVTLGAAAITVPLETVTTGRTYYITDMILTTTSAAILAQLTAATIPLFQAHINSTKGIEAQGIETQPTATTGQAVALVFPAGTGVVAYSIYGIEA